MTVSGLLGTKKLILASASPRRKQLISGLDIPYECRIPQGHSEDFPSSLQREKVAEFLAVSKADYYKSQYAISNEEIVLTADTIVWFDNRVLNKPANEAEAFSMLKELSGKTHEVFTGVCLMTPEKQKVFSSLSVVEFAPLDEEEIAYYIRTYKPYDKAGSYGAQEWIGYVAIKRIEGSFFNVMGLPIRQVYAELKNLLNS